MISFISRPPQAFYPLSSLSLLYQLSRECLQNLLHNIITMVVCALQVVLYQTLSRPTVPTAIQLTPVSFSRPAMVGNWTVSPSLAKRFSTDGQVDSGLLGQTYLVGDDKVSFSESEL